MTIRQGFGHLFLRNENMLHIAHKLQLKLFSRLQQLLQNFSRKLNINETVKKLSKFSLFLDFPTFSFKESIIILGNWKTITFWRNWNCFVEYYIGYEECLAIAYKIFSICFAQIAVYTCIYKIVSQNLWQCFENFTEPKKIIARHFHQYREASKKSPKL